MLSLGQLTLNTYLVDTPGVVAYLLDVANLWALSDLKFGDTNFSIYTINDHHRQAHIRVPIADQEGYGMSFIRPATQECHQGYREVLEATKDSIECAHDIASRTRLKL